ncbi:T9SS type A sorting domain-containing protein [Flavobacterium oreochromis]|uniref:T9SS type A sorting domain-containing protein n=1 Tax=Flavobacterium oreochromis TaxID=2906078 RepID=A0ABW8PC76_9FLAO|nr:T9SS type A sorting domain-containing protein [Flavobacterium oreochromis]OWP74564.1 hypothetical protein BWG23_13605 [Flavobacterium oreochromis]
MKKNILLFLFVTNSIVAQLNLTGNAYYRFECTLNVRQGSEGSACGYGGLEWLYVQKNNGAKVWLKDNDGSQWQWTSRFFNSSNTNNKFDESNLVSSFRIRSNHRVSSWGSCSTESLWEHSVPIQKVNNVTYYDDQVFAQWFYGNLNINTYPVVNLVNAEPVNDIIGDEDFIDFPNISGIENQYYIWQYATSPLGPWSDLPSAVLRKNSLHIKANSFLPDTLIGLNFYMRVTTGVSHANEQGSLITLRYRKSAPHIKTISLNNTRCNYTTDGKILVTLDRKPFPFEKLGYEMKYADGTIYKSIAIGDLDLKGTDSFTIQDIPAGEYSLKILGAINSIPTYNLGENHIKSFKIEKPLPLTFSLSKVDVWCHGGNDGSITIKATGGNTSCEQDNTRQKAVSNYQYQINNSAWEVFNNGDSTTITSLSQGVYTIKVRDCRTCMVLDNQGQEQSQTIRINQPSEAVSVNYTQVLQPTFYGGTNGRLVAKITGGTRFADNSYAYEWKNSQGVLQTVTPYYDAATQSYYLTLNGIPSDTYSLTVTDKNYSSATYKSTCTIANSQQYLGQPDPIVVTLDLVKGISCNVTNEFGNETDMNPYDNQRDESQDGIIKATVTGGVVFNTGENGGLPYKFFWKKQQANGTWTAWNDFDATAENLSHGNYALNVEDKNGIRLGVYVNNVLTQESPKTYFLSQPDKLELTFVKGAISCSAGNNGWITAVPSGGVPPYRYEWTNGGTTNQIVNLTANNYFVKVTDSKGCIVQGAMNIEQPNGVEINGVITSPTCHDGQDGSVQVEVKGGTAPYTYAWSTHATTKDISNLSAGDYKLKLVDANGCTYFKEFTLDNPAAVTLNLGEDRTLCNGQHLDLDISIADPLAQYTWQSKNGFTANTPKVSLTAADTYTAKIITSKGCTAEDEVVIKNNQVAISSEFFLTSQAYKDEEVILINASKPLGENTIWQIPSSVKIIKETEDYIVLQFNTVGSFTISLKQTQGDCYALYSKVINVEEKTIHDAIGNSSNPFIEEFVITPNPNQGQFSSIVKLKEESPIKMRLYSLTGHQPIIEKYETGLKSYVVDFDLSIAAGTYALILETSKETLIKKIIIY